MKRVHQMATGTRALGLAALFLMAAAPADAQLTFVTPDAQQAGAPRPARADGPPLAYALTAAQGAVQACEAKGFKVTAAVVDSVAAPVVILSGNGAALITQAIAMGKATSAVKIGLDSGTIAQNVKTDPALAAKVAADPQMGVQRPGAVVIKRGESVWGAIAVSGTPSGAVDAECAQTGLSQVNK